MFIFIDRRIMMHTNEELDNLLQMPLEDKITMSKLRITEFYEHYVWQKLILKFMIIVCINLV